MQMPSELEFNCFHLKMFTDKLWNNCLLSRILDLFPQVPRYSTSHTVCHPSRWLQRNRHILLWSLVALAAEESWYSRSVRGRWISSLLSRNLTPGLLGYFAPYRCSHLSRWRKCGIDSFSCGHPSRWLENNCCIHAVLSNLRIHSTHQLSLQLLVSTLHVIYHRSFWIAEKVFSNIHGLLACCSPPKTLSTPWFSCTAHRLSSVMLAIMVESSHLLTATCHAGWSRFVVFARCSTIFGERCREHLALFTRQAAWYGRFSFSMPNYLANTNIRSPRCEIRK